MTQNQPIPHLFGRFTAVIAGHRDLALTLLELRSVCAALEDDQPLAVEQAAPPVLIGRLRADLSEHFAAEESDGYFGALLTEEPALSPRIAELEQEHDLMLQIVDALYALALDTKRWAELPRATRELLSLIDRHERAESMLVGQLLSVRAP